MVVCIQEPFLGSRNISHSRFNLYWPSGTDKRRDMRVFTAVRKDIVNQVTVENRSDLTSHPYCLILDLKETYPESSKKLPRKTRVVNVYDNKLREGYPWQRSTTRVRRAIEDMSWRLIIQGRVLIVGDVNAHSTIWNP